MGGNIGYGVPISLHAVLIGLNANLALGLVVIGFAVRQWAGGHGTWTGRTGYTLVALSAAVSLWLAWTFNVVGYLF